MNGEKDQLDCPICEGRGVHDIQSNDQMEKTKTEPCPECYSIREPFIKHIKKMSKIWKIAWNTCLLSDYMANPQTREERIFINKNPFFNLIRHSLFRVAILESMKLIRPYVVPKNTVYKCSNEDCPNRTAGKNKKHKFTIDRLFNKAHNSKWKLSIRDHEVLWLNIKEDYKVVYDGVRTLRDKLYAHDDNHSIEATGFTYAELKDFLLEIRNLIIDLNANLAYGDAGVIINMELGFEQRVEKLDDFRILVEAKEQRRNNLFGSLRR